MKPERGSSGLNEPARPTAVRPVSVLPTLVHIPHTPGLRADRLLCLKSQRSVYLTNLLSSYKTFVLQNVAGRLLFNVRVSHGHGLRASTRRRPCGPGSVSVTKASAPESSIREARVHTELRILHWQFKLPGKLPLRLSLRLPVSGGRWMTRIRTCSSKLE